MKKYFVTLILAFIYHLSFSQNSFILNESETCSPNFKEIYDFQVGDVFQYREESVSSWGGLGATTTITSKFTIVNKTVSGDTITYSVSGIKKKDYSCSGGWDFWCDTPSESNTFEEELKFIDSANHFLNKCDSSIASDFTSEYGLPDGEKIYSYIKIDTINNQIVKSIGGPNNILILNDKDSLILANTIEFDEVYAKYLGLLSRYYWQFEHSESKVLEGYIIGGDTTGTITDNEDMLINTVEINSFKNFAIFPNPTNGILHFKTGAILKNKIQYELYDISGNKLIVEPISNDFIDLTHLNKNLYILKIIIDNKVITKKILIE